jgi:ribosomal protein S14
MVKEIGLCSICGRKRVVKQYWDEGFQEFFDLCQECIRENRKFTYKLNRDIKRNE